MKKRLSDKLIVLSEKPGRDSRGSSLIEVIVAMLVLAIIIVPMLEMFTSAARINGRARERQYANTVLENTMEELRAGNFTFVYDTADAKSEENHDVDGQLCLYCPELSDGDFTDDVFLTAAMAQGTSEFQAKIRFSAEEYRLSGGGIPLNDYEMPDINNYDSTNCELLLLDNTEDTTIRDWFYALYLEQGMEEYSQRLQEAWINSEAYLYQYNPSEWIERWYAEHGEDAIPPEDYEPEPFEAATAVASFTPLEMEEFCYFIRKDTEIRVEPIADEYTVKYTIRYTVNESAARMHLDVPFSETHVYEAGTDSRFTAENLKYLYIFYPPFSHGLLQESMVIDAEDISTHEEWNCRIYLAIQNGASGELTSGVDFLVTVRLDEGLSSAERESRVKLLSAGGVRTTANQVYELVPVREAEPTVYQVSVQLVKAGSDEVLCESKTTVYFER